MPDWSLMDVIPKAGLEAWYQVDPAVNTATSCPDYSGNGRNLTVASNAPVLAESPANGELGYYFDGTKDPLAWSGSVTAKHIFAVIAFDKRYFAGCEGVISGLTSGNVLTSKQAGTTFYPFGSDYRRNDVEYADNDQQAPVNGSFALVELILAGGGVAMNGIQIGKQLNLSPARLFNGWFLGAGIYSTEQNDIARLKWITYVAMRYHIWPQSADGLSRFPFASNRPRSRNLDVEHYLSEPYEGESKALVRDEQDDYQWLFSTRLEEEYRAAEAFYEQHRPLEPFVMRDYRYLPPRDLEQIFASGLREQGSDVTWRHNYSFETARSEHVEAEAEIQTPTNWALNADVTANRTYLESRPEQAVNGFRHTQGNWGPGDADGGTGGWDSDQGPTGTEPAELIVDFGVERTFSHVKMFTLRNSTDYSDEPTTEETFSSWGNTSYELEYWNGYAWVNFISVTGNNKVVREHDFVAITASKVKFIGLGTADHTSSPHARLVELEIWSDDPDWAVTAGPLEVLQRAIRENQWPHGLPTNAETSFTAGGGVATAAWTPGSTSDLLTFTVYTGLTLEGYVFRPLATPPVGGVIREDWILFNGDHSPLSDSLPRIKYFVDRGFHVVAVFLPNYEPNDASWNYAHSMSGTVAINNADHSQYASVIEADGTPILPLFVDQIFRAANWIREEAPTAKIHLTGHSGGGFVTSIASALDAGKIFTVKNSNAGELPFALDDTPVHVEQAQDRPFFLGKDWTDLYPIAARFGKFTKTLNEQDMFFEARYRHHVFREVADDVNAAIAGDYPGECDIYFDVAATTHEYTDWSKQKFVDDCLAFAPGSYPVLDLVTTPVWAAYSLKQLYTTYTGPAIRVLDDEGVEADIGFASDGTLDTASLSGDSPYKIIKIYDQSEQRGPAVPVGNDLDRAPWLNVGDKSIRFLDAGDPFATAFEFPDMSALTQAEAFMRRKLAESPSVDGVGGWWRLSTSADQSHTPYTDGNCYDQFGSAERRGPFSHSATIGTTWHVMNAHSVHNDWAFKINNTVLSTDATNVVAFPTVPIWGAARSTFEEFAKGYSMALVIFSKKCSAVDRYSVVAGL